MARGRTCRRRLALAAGLACVGAGLVGSFLVGTHRGRQWLAEGLSLALSGDGYEVRLEDLRLAWPARMAFARVAVSDACGPWLEIRAVDAQWRLKSLLARRLEIGSLRVESLEVARWPLAEQPAAPASPPSGSPAVLVRDASCARIRMAAAASGQPLEILELHGQVAGGGTSGMASVQFHARAKEVSYGDVAAKALAAEGGIFLAASRWDLAGVLAGEGFRVSAELGFADPDPWPTGRLQAEFDAASGVVAKPWPELETGRFELSWDCPPRSDGIQEGEIRFSADAVNVAAATLRHAAATANLRRTCGQTGFQVAGAARLDAQALESLSVTGAEIRVAGPWPDFDWSLVAAGAYVQPYDVDISGRLRWDAAECELELNRAGVGWGVGRARLTQPLRMRMKAGEISIRGAADLETVDLSAIVQPGLPPLRGTLSGSARIDGTLAAPAIQLAWAGSGIQASTGIWATLPPAEGRGQVSVSNGWLRLAAQTSIATGGFLRAEAEAPLSLSFYPWKWEVDAQSPLSADLHADMDLSPADRVAGRVQAEMRIEGRPAAPRFEGWVASTGLVVRTDTGAALPAVEGRIETTGADGRLRVSGAARMAGSMAQASGTAQLPWRFSLAPWEANLDRAGEGSADFRANLDLALLNAFDWAVNSQMGGRVDLALAHSGSLENGTLAGTCTLANGSYENYVWGTVVREAGLRLVSRGNQWVVESGGATDGGGGRVKWTGQIRPDPAAGLPFELGLEFRRMQLLRRPDAEATVSGELTLAGSLARLRAEGDLQLDNALVDLRNLRPPRPVQLEEPLAAAPAAAAPQTGGDPLELRLGIRIPGTLYVRSRVLDSAWSGRFDLERTEGTPRFVGHLEPRRGTVLLLQRPFRLDAGRVDFDGRWPPLPTLRLEAVFNRADLQARAAATGPALDPDIALTSIPPLPEDEIMARILFGEDMAGLTPLQAVSLAAEASKLGKLGGGGGVLGELQATLGIDRVEFRETGSETAQTEVAVGKYLGDKSYVEMRRATAIDSTERTRLYLEHEIRPNIVLEAESGLEMRSGLGLFWKRDY